MGIQKQIFKKGYYYEIKKLTLKILMILFCLQNNKEILRKIIMHPFWKPWITIALV